LLAIDPRGLGGASIKAGAGPVRDAWLRHFKELASPTGAIRRLPVNIDDHSLLGGLDMTATLAAGRPVANAGLLAASHDGVLLAPMAERMTTETAAAISSSLDEGVVRFERDGVSSIEPAEFTCVLFDESVEDYEAPPPALLERLAFQLDLSALPVGLAETEENHAPKIAMARKSFASVSISDDTVHALATIAEACGVPSTRTLFHLVRAARAAAAFEGREKAVEHDAATAVRLVLSSRAFSLIAPEEEATPPQPDGDPADPEQREHEDNLDKMGALHDTLIEALRGADISHLLNRERSVEVRRRQRSKQGKSGAAAKGVKGRPRRSRPGDPKREGRLDICATLLAAAPWQKVRARTAGLPIVIRKQDFRIRTYEQKSESVVIFVVDASGSAAISRMAEAKGAVEMLLGDCYSRRDHVALITFRGEAPDLALPPTRSLVRARRLLARLPGGGATPLASALCAAESLAASQSGRGRTPFIVIMSDGRGNIARDGQADREQSEIDTVNAAKQLKYGGYQILFFDTSRRPDERAARLADSMGASYEPLPFAGAAAVSSSIKAVIRN
jgi:magnesium chelatase subunit D